MEVTAASQQPESGSATVVRKNRRLELGETLETDAVSKASVAVAEIGRLEVEPMTRLRLLQSGTRRKRIALDRGTIHATIWAPPGQFVVDTPSAVAVDLGCMYTLYIDDAGSGILRTTLGWVGFHRGGRESFIPAGAACATHAQSGPGTPYFEDASDVFRSALARLDSLEPAPSSRKSALDVVLHEARARDALTLWHLLPRVSTVERPAVYDRLAALVPPPITIAPNLAASFPRENAASHYYAARETSATPLSVKGLSGDQHEKFLFYRGVSTVSLPLSAKVYIVPRPYLDSILPLSINPAPVQLVRVFVGRIELVTPATEESIEAALASHDAASLRKYGRFLGPIFNIIVEKQSDPQRAARLFDDLSASYH